VERLELNREEDFMEVNVEGSRTVLEKAREVGVKAFVYTSSADVVKGSSWQDLVNVNERCQCQKSLIVRMDGPR
jgi:sterol-4alpha-carboxylate 3-dehydrogenase (decarboxylating)